MKYNYLLAAVAAIASVSCATKEPVLVAVKKPEQQTSYLNGNPTVISSKSKSRVSVRGFDRPFYPDKQMVLAVSVDNRSKKSVKIGQDDLKCFVNGKEVKVQDKKQKLTQVKGAIAGLEIGKFLSHALAGASSGLANTHTATSSYSFNAGGRNYYGTASSSYYNAAGAAAMNRQYSNDIEASTAPVAATLRELKSDVERDYFEPHTVAGGRWSDFLISPKVSKRASKFMVQVKVGEEVHQLNFELRKY